MSPAAPRSTANDIPSLTVEGYRFYRSDGRPFDNSIQTFVPPHISYGRPPYAFVTINDVQDGFTSAGHDDEEEPFYHTCTGEVDTTAATAAITATSERRRRPPFVLANRCTPSWTNLSTEQRDVIAQIEDRVNRLRDGGVYFCPVILEGAGGCGKTRLMAYAINHSPESTHVLYMTKQNKRLQDFLYDELAAGEEVPPPPVTDMSRFAAEDFRTIHTAAGGRYACSVEKLVYNMGGYQIGRNMNDRDTLQWKLNIPDRLFAGDNVASNRSDVVVFLDEYTMIAPPLLHKMLHCVDTMFDAPTVLIMGGDKCQLGPINWSGDVDVECRYADRCGEEAPPGAVTRNNRYYTSDVRTELERRVGQKPFEYNMKAPQRSRDDPDLVRLVLYLRRACEKRTSSKAIERRLVTFGRLRAIDMFRHEVTRVTGCRTGLLVFRGDDNGGGGGGRTIDGEQVAAAAAAFDDAADEDRHLGDDDDDAEEDEEEGGGGGGGGITIDWNRSPGVDMTPFILFYADLYRRVYDGICGKVRPSGTPRTVSDFVYDEASRFVRESFPVFMVKKNDKCNMLSDMFLKTLYNGVYRKLTDEYDTSDVVSSPMSLEEFLQRMCVSLSLRAGNLNPVHQTIMVGVPYRMTDTLRHDGSPVICNGELVLLTEIAFEGIGDRRRVSYANVKTLQQRRSNGGGSGGGSGRILTVVPGVTRNRLSTGSGVSASEGPAAYMFPMVPTICENIYQLQGNTIVSNCYIDLLSTNSTDIYVAISRFRNASSIRGIVLSR